MVSKNFSLVEVIRSNYARANGINNKPTQQIIINATVTAQLGLQTFREHTGLPVNPTSWFRNPQLNAAVGGVPHSLHQTGFGVDFQVNGMTVDEVLALLKKRKDIIQYDKAILERFQNKSTGAWIEWTHFQMPRKMGDKCRYITGKLTGDRNNPTWTQT